MRIAIASIAAAATLVTGVSLVALAPTGEAATTVAVQNPSLEVDANADSVPDCWQRNSWGTNTGAFSRVSTGHSGSYAEKVAISSYSSGSQRLLTALTSTCAPALTTGHTYSVSGWYESAGSASWVALYQSRTTGAWKYWASGPILAASSSWKSSSFRTPSAPSDAARLSFGIALQSVGTLTVDDFSLSDLSVTGPTPTPTTSSTTSPSPSPRPTASTTTASPSPSATTTAPASGHTWYVSKTGNNADGRTWATAWNELANIQWSLVQPGDRVVIDGGSTACPSNYDFANHATNRPGLTCGMEYTTALTVRKSGTSSAPISIQLAQDAGRNGTVVIFGGRSTMLPYCDQTSYAASGTAKPNGVSIPGYSNIVIDGRHRSGIMLYGAQDGVDLSSDATSYVTLRNMEIFDNGIFSTWSYGYKTDNEGISLVGHNITIDRDLIHDNGQDEIQDRYTGTLNNNSHAAMHDITITNSWLYDHRANPLFPGYGFNAGS
ncbi:MAG: hypothetical protein QOF39_2167, partial [Frankiales bacterium]|nr:hypothetical protein [Frankiales bacterium]